MLAVFTVCAAFLLVQGLRSGQTALILAPTVAVARRLAPWAYWACAAINGLSALGGVALAGVLPLTR